MGEARVKGTVIIPSVEYIKNKYGESTFQKVVSRTSPASQKVLNGRILASSWYDVDVIVEYLTAAEALLKGKDPHIVDNLGKASADYAARGVYKVFLMVTSPTKVIHMSPHIWAKYYSFGKMEIVENSDGSATLHLVDSDFSSEILCRRIRGWMERVIELTGGKNPAVKHTKCQSRGADYEEYIAKWD